MLTSGASWVLQVWADPLEGDKSNPLKGASWPKLAQTAWDTSPLLALCLLDRWATPLFFSYPMPVETGWWGWSGVEDGTVLLTLGFLTG